MSALAVPGNRGPFDFITWEVDCMWTQDLQIVLGLVGYGSTFAATCLPVDLAAYIWI